MANRFWVGGAGTWGGGVTTHWSATSGGASGASEPTSADDAKIDANSGLALFAFVTTSGAVSCRSLDTTGQTQGGLKVNTGSVLSIGDSVGGSLTIATNNGIFQNLGTIALVSTTTGNTVTSGGFALGNITINGVGGSWTGQDGILASAVVHTAGAFSCGLLSPTSWTSYTYNGTGGATLSLSPAQTNVIATFNAVCGYGNVLTINSATPGTTATLSISSKSTICRYVSVKDITVTGGTKFTAYNSIDQGHNTSVQFVASTNLSFNNQMAVRVGDGMGSNERWR